MTLTSESLQEDSLIQKMSLIVQNFENLENSMTEEDLKLRASLKKEFCQEIHL